VTWQDIDWGNAPAWTSSILTSGSLGLGFYILLRDRRTSEREQARKVTVWYEYMSNGYGVCYVHNASDQPIRNVSVLAQSTGSTSTRPKPARIYKRWASIKPQTTEEAARNFVKEYPSAATFDFNLGLSFDDAAGFQWWRDGEGKLRRPLRPRRWLPKQFR
jgi:hypothetical protein